jgi:hypothetical protein
MVERWVIVAWKAQLGIIALLDGSVERVHVHVDDFAGAHLATILFRVPERCEREVISSRSQTTLR